MPTSPAGWRNSRSSYSATMARQSRPPRESRRGVRTSRSDGWSRVLISYRQPITRVSRSGLTHWLAIGMDLFVMTVSSGVSISRCSSRCSPSASRCRWALPPRSMSIRSPAQPSRNSSSRTSSSSRPSRAWCSGFSALRCWARRSGAFRNCPRWTGCPVFRWRSASTARPRPACWR